MKDKISEVLTGAQGLAAAVDRIAKEDEVFFSERFVLPRPLLKAITSEKPVVLLIDEIDKADAEFEAFLLELLSDFQVTVPEIGTFKARQIPLVVLTSNNAREMSDALKRRCLHLYIDFPERDQEIAIVKLKVPEAADKLADEVVTVVQSLRKLDLKKSPGISETIDWVKALTLLNVQNLDQDLVNETLDTIVKYEGDVRKAQEELKEYVRRARARRGSDAGQPAVPGERQGSAKLGVSARLATRTRVPLPCADCYGRQAGRIRESAAPKRRPRVAGRDARCRRGVGDDRS